MKVLFAARMARFDLLRATQGLASRVTKWSPDCDKSLHRLMCYIHPTLDRTMVGFVGDPPESCKTWLFADSDHAGEHDNRSTSGCPLALVGPNTFYPLTDFSKKQTSTAMSSTEAEVTAANLALRAVGLPSSCLWSVIRHAGGDSTQQKQSRRVETRAKNPKNTKDDYWEHVPFTNQVTRVHVKPRNKLYNPINSDCPVNLQGLARQRCTIMKTKNGDVEFDLTWDWTTPDADVVNDFEWTGKTVFRIPGPNEVDYGVESREIRSALTDFKYIGSEKRGDESVYMAGPGSLEVIFLEDNQATIRILESGRSPSFRHTDKTQRLNLSWLSEQFKRKHFNLVLLVHHFKQQTSSPSPLPTLRSGNQLCDWWVFHHSLFRGRRHRRWKPAQGNLQPGICHKYGDWTIVFIRVFWGFWTPQMGIELGPYQGHALMRPGPSNAQGNLLALQWHPTAGYSLNFVADLIQSLVIGQENIPRIVMSSDVLKKEMLHLGRIEWTLETKWFKPLNVQLFSLVLSWSGLAFHALVALHAHMWTCNMNQPNSKLNIIDMFLKTFGHQWLISSILFVI